MPYINFDKVFDNVFENISAEIMQKFIDYSLRAHSDCEEKPVETIGTATDYLLKGIEFMKIL